MRCKTGCRTYVLSGIVLSLPRVMIKNRETSLAQRVLGAVDLAIDLATLGEYGLEPVPAEGPCRERPGRARRQPRRAASEAPSVTGWEALTAPRRGNGPCDRTPAVRARRSRARV